MRWFAGCWMTVAALWGIRAACAPPPDPVASLPGIRAGIARSLTHLPNYTCEERIVRYERPRPGGELRLLDRIHLEVAFVGGRELFGWPGVQRFEDKSLESLIGGTTGTGAFAGIPVQIFGSKLSIFSYRTNEATGPLHYNFQYPVEPNGFVVGVGDRRGIVGFNGAFWMDEAGTHLQRIEVQADHIPAHVPLEDMHLNLTYQTIHLDEREYVVPQTAEQTMLTTSGYFTRNVTTFSGCHQFRGETTIKFDDSESQTWDAAKAKVIDLPEQLGIEAVLTADLRSAEPAIGDLVEAEVARDVKKGHDVILPKGAKLLGRITRVRFVEATPQFHIAAVTFHTARFGHTEAHFHTTTNGVGGTIQVASRPSWRSGNSISLDRLRDNLFFVQGNRFLVPRGTRFYLTTTKEAP